jgi:hypothetical protein
MTVRKIQNDLLTSKNASLKSKVVRETSHSFASGFLPHPEAFLFLVHHGGIKIQGFLIILSFLRQLGNMMGSVTRLEQLIKGGQKCGSQATMK